VAEAPAGDYFGTFLDKVGSQVQQQSNDRLRTILLALASKSPQPVLDLAKASGMSLTDFTSELDAAQTSGFVEVTGPPADERVELTESGAELARHLAQS
jgi:DNA-binding MarR family transcriptional regulator